MKAMTMDGNNDEEEDRLGWVEEEQGSSEPDMYLTTHPSQSPSPS